MSEELLQANGTVGAAALSVKGMRGGKHANRKQGRKGTGFAEALAALATGGKAGPAKAGVKPAAAPAGVAPAPRAATALPAETPIPARTKEAHRRAKGFVSAEATQPAAVPAGEDAAKIARPRHASARRAPEGGVPANASEHPAPAAGSEAATGKPAESRHAHGKGKSKEAGDRRTKDAEISRATDAPLTAVIDPLATNEQAAAAFAATAMAGAQPRPANAAPEVESGARRPAPAVESAHKGSVSGRQAATPVTAAARSWNRIDAAEAPGGKRDFAPEMPADDASPAPVAAPGPEVVHAKPAGRRAGEARAAAEPQSGPLGSPAAAAHPDPDVPATAATAPTAPFRANPGAQAGKPQSAPVQPMPDTAKAAAPAATGTRQDTPAAGVFETPAGHHSRIVSSTAPRPADPQASAAPAAVADPLVAADKPKRNDVGGAKAEAAAHGHRETAASVPVTAPPAGDPSGERRDAAAGESPQPFFVQGADPARRADFAATIAKPSETAPDAPPDFTPLHEQVGMRLATLPDGTHEIALQLSPENLGNLRIDLKLSGGRMDATVRAENPEAREALLRDIPALREALATSGITLSSFDVSLTGGGSFAEQQAPRQAGGWETGQGHRPRHDGEADSAAGGFRPGRATPQSEAAGGAGGHWIA
jgi:flagellar hook-length control protein FliK